LACLPVENTPRLFLGFPLVGTENFNFPAVINSVRFTPTEGRDGIYLGQSEDDTNLNNQAVIGEACELLVELLRYTASSGWHDAHLLVAVPTIHERDWLNSEWLRKRLGEWLIERVRQTCTVLNEAGEEIPRDKLKLPVAETDEGVETLWDLLDAWQGERERLPRRNEAVGWRNAVESWAGISERQVSSFDETIDGCKLALCVAAKTKKDNEEFGRLENLQHLLREDICAVEWMNRLYAYLTDNGFNNAIRTRPIVLAQDGHLDRLSNLYCDRGIAEELKDIAELLGWDIRLELRDTRLTSLNDESGAGNWNSDYVVGELIKRLQKCAEEKLDDDFEKASVRLFAWVVGQEEWDLLRGFPVFSVGDSNSRGVIKLERAEGDDERPLAPVRAWSEDLQPFSELFPPCHTLSDGFFEVAPDFGTWRTLSENGFLRNDAIIPKTIHCNAFLPDEPLNDDQEHRTAEHVTATSIAFLTKDKIGIMERVRGSQRLACIFWRFITEWLIVHDSEGLKINEALCDCGKNHHYYPAAWLPPLVRNRWVSIGGDRREQVTARLLAGLLRDSGWNPSSLGDNPDASNLLKAIGVTHFDLLREFSAPDDEQRKAQDEILAGMLAATDGNLSHLSLAREYIEYLKSDDALPGILAERHKRRQIVHKNQRLGKQVENLVRQSLEDEGFTVKRVPIGSDFEIEHDLVEQDEEVGIETSRNGRKWLIEIKATRDQYVRMTATQAKTAADRKDGFLLCVVPVECINTELDLDEVRAAMRFVANLGSRVDKLCNDFAGFEELRGDITANESDGIQLEVISGAARVRVASSVWRTGVCLKGLPQLLSGKG
jgi:predicted RecB family endonuclease